MGLIPKFDGAKLEIKSLIPKHYEEKYKYLDAIQIEIINKKGFTNRKTTYRNRKPSKIPSKKQ